MAISFEMLTALYRRMEFQEGFRVCRLTAHSCGAMASPVFGYRAGRSFKAIMQCTFTSSLLTLFKIRIPPHL